ncbi:hypothetical protein NEUTE2DRAFT_80929, partial [Neurospora tetrasperma FGSC 2509]
MFLIESSGDDLLPIFSFIDRYEFPTLVLPVFTEASTLIGPHLDLVSVMTCDIYLDQEPVTMAKPKRDHRHNMISTPTFPAFQLPKKRREETNSVAEPRSVGGVIRRGEGKQLIGDP